MSIPATLTEIGIPSDRVSDIAVMAVADPSSGGNPIALTAKDYEGILRNALTGEIALQKKVA
jgi:alcohol dehydrogenase class IV